MIDISNADDLHRVYMFVYDNFACSTTDVVDNVPGVNSRYARELLGTLQHADLIVITEGDEGDVWQSNPSYDTMTTEEAEAKFSEWAGPQAPLSATPTSKTRPAKSASKDPHTCLCGCGEAITTKALYRPGHDARHAGMVGRRMADVLGGSPTAADKKNADVLVEALPTDALREKAFRVRDNAMAKGSKAAAQSQPTCVEGIIKVGKNERPARRWSGGSVEYLVPGQSEWKPASATATKTFQEG